MRDKDKRQYFNVELEKRVLSYYVRRDNTIAVRLEYFTAEETRQLFLFSQKYRRLSDDFEEWWELWKIELERLGKEPLSPYRKFLQSLWIEEVDEIGEQIDYYLQQLRGFAEARQLYTVYRQSIGLYKKGEVTEARQVLEDGMSKLRQDFGSQVLSRGDFVEGFRERYKEYKGRKTGEREGKIPTGIARLDRRISGTAKASLNLIQGESGSGKTFLLQELAYKSLLRSHRTIFVTVELQRNEIETRWDGRVTGLDYLDIDSGKLTKQQEAWWKKRMRDIQKVYRQGGRLATVFIPEGCTVMALESELDYWETQWGEKINTLVVDYADLMQSARKTFSEQEFQGAVFRDLKRLSQTKDVVLWTASQLSGKSFGKSRIKINDTGYSMKKTNWANLIIGIGGDPDDMESGIMRLWISKNTFGPSGFEIVLYTDFAKGRIDIRRKKKDE